MKRSCFVICLWCVVMECWLSKYSWCIGESFYVLGYYLLLVSVLGICFSCSFSSLFIIIFFFLDIVNSNEFIIFPALAVILVFVINGSHAVCERGGGMNGGGALALESCLSSNLSSSITVKDPGVEVLALLRILHGLSKHWHSLYLVCMLLVLCISVIVFTGMSG